MSRSRKRKWMLLTVLLTVILCTGCLSKYNRGTYDLYLIPDHFEGVIRVVYNVEGAPRLEREEKYDIIPVDKNGHYYTSNPMYDYGKVIDQYYYVDDEGNRKEIEGSCIYIIGTGGSVTNGIETHYTEIEVTNSKCGEDFMLNGSIR